MAPAFTRRSGKRMRVSTSIANEHRHLLHHDDFISRLPDDILLKILDKLSMEDAVVTSMLSWRWTNLWRFISCVDFNYKWEQRTGKRINNSVKKFIKEYKGLKIKSFFVSFRYNYRMENAVTSWIEFAVKNHVEELYLDFNDINNKMKRRTKQQLSFQLPTCLFSCSTLVKMKLKFLKINLASSFHLESLRELHLDWTKLSEDAIQRITASCPALRLLQLTNCNNNHNLNVSVSPTSNLSRLIIKEDFMDIRPVTDILISAPKVEVIEFWSSMPRMNYHVENILAGVEVSFNVNDLVYYQTLGRINGNQRLAEFSQQKLQGLLKKFQTAKVIHLSKFFIQYIPINSSINPRAEETKNFMVPSLGSSSTGYWTTNMGASSSHVPLEGLP